MRKQIYIIPIAIAIILGVEAWNFSQPTLTPAPEFTLTDAEGNTLRLRDFRGKTVLIDFMATWCGPCKQQMVQYRTVWEQYRDRVVFMSIDIDPQETDNTLRQYAQQFPYASWIWTRDTASLLRTYNVTAIPKTVIIDRNGYIRNTYVGVTSASTLIQDIEAVSR